MHKDVPKINRVRIGFLQKETKVLSQFNTLCKRRMPFSSNARHKNLKSRENHGRALFLPTFTDCKCLSVFFLGKQCKKNHQKQKPKNAPPKKPNKNNNTLIESNTGKWLIFTAGSHTQNTKVSATYCFPKSYE